MTSSPHPPVKPDPSTPMATSKAEEVIDSPSLSPGARFSFIVVCLGPGFEASKKNHFLLGHTHLHSPSPSNRTSSLLSSPRRRRSKSIAKFLDSAPPIWKWKLGSRWNRRAGEVDNPNLPERPHPAVAVVSPLHLVAASSCCLNAEFPSPSRPSKKGGIWSKC
ncbi:unnamed protein product [Linum trigynum]|uniref:Uncharacterized protein n=1 Tax=Linum trigynum TaxID=586398 RepID=A0AAV2E5U1_9ROSI